MAQIFKEYDIRGKAEIDFDSNFVYELGKALATYFTEHNASVCAIGQDCRTTSPMYSDALCKGLTEGGIDCIRIGMVPSPCLYYGVKHLNLTAGVMITASHNPGEYNGFKVVCGESTIAGPEIQKLKKLIDDKNFITSEKLGTITDQDIVPAYVADIKERFPSVAKYKVVVDAGNGAASLVAPMVLKALGAEVIELYCEPDGTFPNHHPDPTVEKNIVDLREAVLKHGADVGFGFDGDGDRLGVVGRNGKHYMGDEIVAVFARELLMREPNATIIADVKSSERLYSDPALNGRVRMNQTGHSLIKKAMKEFHALMAGELSGHLFFKDNWYGFDDATYSAARLLNVLTELKSKASLTLEDLPNWEELYSTPEITLPMEDENKVKVIEHLQNHYKDSEIYDCNTMDGVRLVRKGQPLLWALMRKSNTSPYLTIRAEAKNKDEAEALIKELQDLALKAKDM